MSSLRAVKQGDLTAGSETLWRGGGNGSRARITYATRADLGREWWEGGYLPRSEGTSCSLPGGGSRWERLRRDQVSSQVRRHLRRSLPCGVVLAGAHGRRGYPQEWMGESRWELVAALFRRPEC